MKNICSLRLVRSVEIAKVTGCYLSLYMDMRGIQSSNSDYGSLTKLKNFTFYAVLARAGKKAEKNILTSYFCLFSFSMRSNFSASSVSSHCHRSFAFSLLSRKQQCVTDPQLKKRGGVVVM